MKLVRGACQLLLLLSSTTYGIHAKDASNEEAKEQNIRSRKLQEDAKKPNILIILADDVGTSDVPYWGDNIVPMENIQKLKSKGVTFMNAHSSPLCAPSRYMLLSGNYPHRGLQKGGAWNFSAEQNQFMGDQKSIAEVLKEQFNYHTGMYGKWHIGGRVPAGGTYSDDKSRPLSCCDIDWKKPMEDGPNSIGFDESFYTMGGIQSAPYSFFRNEYLQTDVEDIKFWEEGTYATINNNGESIIDRAGEGDPNWDSTEYNTRIVKEVDDFLENHDTADPFFLYVGLGQVHRPHSPPKFYMDGTPVEGVFGDPHLDLLYEMDLVVGSLMSSVEDRGLMENTLVIFVSDNGGLNGLDHTENSDRHFRGAKGSVWEGGYTVPMIIRYDGVLPQQAQRTGLVGLNDIYATLADFIGFDIPDGSAQDSISFAKHAKSINVDSDRGYMGVWSWKNRPAQAIRDSSFKYVIRYSDTREEYLFYLPGDVKEEKNLLHGDQVSSFYKGIRNALDNELRKIGFCPEDIDEQFKIPYGPDKDKQVTCDYFKADPTRCETQSIGEVYCNSVCGRFRDFCNFYDDNMPVTYPSNELPPTGCSDSPTYTFTTNFGQIEDCSWISNKEVRIEKYCPDVEIASMCIFTCNQCDKDIDIVPTSSPECQDDGDFNFIRNDGKNSNCEWLSKKVQRSIKYCPTPSIASGCKLTCDNCSGDLQEENPSPSHSPIKAPVNSPTTSPTTSPTVSPTSSPTTASPTNLPTSSPSASPTTAPTISPTLSPNETKCVDNAEFTFEKIAGGNADCEWLGEKTARINRYCNDESIASECVVACDRCTILSTPNPSPMTNESTPSPTKIVESPTETKCEDNAEFTFEKIAGGNADCEWLGEKTARINRYCSDESIASECVVACDRCTTLATPNPSPLTNESTPSPTKIVDDSPNEPTSSPTDPPISTFDPNCSNTPGYKLDTGSGMKACKWICSPNNLKKMKKRKRNNCQGEVKENCCAACKASTGTSCRY